MKLSMVRNMVAAATCGVVLVCWSVMMSQYRSYDRSSVVLENKKADLLARKNEMAVLKETIEHYRAEKEEFEKLLFNERDVPAFLDQIAQYAQKAGINIVDMKTQSFVQIQPDKELTSVSTLEQKRLQRSGSAGDNKVKDKDNAPEPVPVLSAMPISMKVNGTFAAFAQFLDFWQEYRQLVSITNVDIKAGGKYPQLDCDFVIKIYTLKTIDGLKRP